MSGAGDALDVRFDPSHPTGAELKIIPDLAAADESASANRDNGVRQCGDLSHNYSWKKRRRCYIDAVTAGPGPSSI
jgi:hypothetical protein